MKASQKYLNKTFTHPELGTIIVDSINSRVRVNITCIDRGKGWNEREQRYTGYKNSVGWMRGENRQYLAKDTVHINTLK